ncbi:hypothetical protein GGR54DRAFT_642832 [Hypoxylon sp. NC1633]|nr:hypothetical protein GGR54DRAFT_642832 [Hypoxylon sp. NC1633]
MYTQLTLLLNLLLVVAQDNRLPDPNNHFVFPSLPGPKASQDARVFKSNLNFTIGQPPDQPFAWVSDLTRLMVVLCQEGEPDSVREHVIADCMPGSETETYWDGDIGDIDVSSGQRAYLAVYSCSGDEDGEDADPDDDDDDDSESDNASAVFLSHYINLVTPPPDATESSVSETQTSLPPSDTPLSADVAVAGTVVFLFLVVVAIFY